MKLIFKIIVYGLLISLLPVSVEATTCAQTLPLAGVIKEIGDRGTAAVLTLEQTGLYSEEPQSGIYSLDKYEDVVKEYINNNFQPFSVIQKPSAEDETWINTVFISSDVAEIKKGDIFFRAGPLQGCTYGVQAIFTDTGELKVVMVTDSGRDYVYRNMRLSVNIGKQLSCDNTQCKVDVRYKLNNEKFVLAPGQWAMPKNSIVKSMRLNEASVPKESGNASGPNISYVLYLTELKP